MKLSDLVNQYNQLCALSTEEAKQVAYLVSLEIAQLVSDSQVACARENLLKSFAEFDSAVTVAQKRIHDQIRELEIPYLQSSYQTYEQNRSYRYEWFKMELPKNLPGHLADQPEIKKTNVQRHVENVLNRRLDISKDSETIIEHRIRRYCGWQSTAMILHPGVENWIDYMLSCDPVYLVDEDYELLQPSMGRFDAAFQNRLRPYVIREDQDQDILWQLPANQFSTILAWNYFNHRPFEVIRKYLTELYGKMRDGGILMMTYNDCDRWPGVLSAETGTALYTPGSLLLSFAENLGFEIEYSFNEDGAWTWIELRKPGQCVSLRGGQPLARILPKPVA